MKLLGNTALILIGFAFLHLIVQAALAHANSPLQPRTYSKRASRVERAYVVTALLISLVTFIAWIVVNFQSL